MNNFTAVTRLATIAGTAVILQMGASVAWAQANDADYQYFKANVQPIFLKHRETHGRCVTCHAGGGNGLALQSLSPGATTWNEEQSKLNYEAVSKIVSPGKPLSSQLLMHPLNPAAGGDVFHSGGHQFASQQDPDWMAIAAWVKQMPPAVYTNIKALSSTDNLMDTMRVFNLSLRTDCSGCHAAPDFAADKKPMKAMARRMITLTQGLAANFGAGKVNCYTCHRGDENPQTTHPRFPDLKPTF